MVRTKVFVGNLSFQTQEAELAAEFGTAGKVISANIITRGPRSLGYGFVEMDSEEDAHNAVKLMSKKEINGREINVEIAKPQDESKVRQPRPPKAEGEEEIRRRRPRRRPAKKEHEEGHSPAHSKKEVREDTEGAEDDRPRRPRNPRSRARGTPGQRRVVSEENREESKTTLFVANLPFSLDDDAFSKVITDLSLKLKSAHVVKKRNGRSKGYGFVEFDSQEDQQKALTALNKKIVDERELSVKVALTELKYEDIQEGQKAAPAPTEKKAIPVAVAEKKTTPAPVAEKKTTPAPAEKKTTPAPVAEKKSTPIPSEKKTTPAPVSEKKTVAAVAPAEKQTASPVATEKKVPAEKKASPAPSAKKSSPAPEKKDDKK